MHRLIRLIGKLLQTCDAILCKVGIKRPTVVVAMDGGICSQMFNYIKGIRYEEAGCKVLFDIRWFKTSGQDLDGKFPRTYELQELFPNLPIYLTSPSKARNWYSRFFKHNKQNGLVRPQDIKRTTFLGSQYEQDFEAFKRLFPKYFNEQTMASVQIPWEKVEGVIHCGVHVRRGDLATPQPEYGMVSDHYFENAIQYVQNKYPHVVFHFFSDEMDWVEQNILPKIDVHYDLIQGNKAWQDLALLSKCDVVIASQGSFGRMAAQVRDTAELLLCKTDILSNRYNETTHITLID